MVKNKKQHPQLANTVLMVNPSKFGYNRETALTNFFQNEHHKSSTLLKKRAIKEFSKAVNILRGENINVLILDSPKTTSTPDAVFPNNWFSYHQDGLLVIYPMLTPNRRKERQIAKLKKLLESNEIKVNRIINLSINENQGRILEGTGSMVLDRINKIAFAMESPRTVNKMFTKWCKVMGYKGFIFRGYDKNDVAIYHTNVMMSIGDGFVVACMEAIKDSRVREMLELEFKKYNKELIPITLNQVYSFCGNILHVLSSDGKRKIIMSKSAYETFTSAQRGKLKKYGDLVSLNIPTIESIGGGSARCMLAEIFK